MTSSTETPPRFSQECAHQALIECGSQNGPAPYGRTPVLPLHHRAGDPGRVVATIPDLERQTLSLGRLVSVEHGNGGRRKGAIEAIHMPFALVRYVELDD